MPPVVKQPPKPGEKKKRKKKKKKIVMRQLKLKGLWLKTPEDWAYFMEWAKKNAQPRRIPPPEPLNRGPKKRLSKFKKRLRTLSQPRIRGTQDCAPLPRLISPSALKAVASKRTKRLARPVLRFEEGCRAWRVKRSALLYEATDTILLLSLPRVRDEPDCRSLGAVSPAAMRRKPTDKDCMLAQPKQRAGDECEERSIECDDSELSPWIDFLAIPNYRVLKEMNNVHLADKYKKRFLSEVEGRSKQAYKEQQRKRKKGERERRRKAAKKKKLQQEKRDKEAQKVQSKSSLKSKSSLGESRTDAVSDTEPEDGVTDDGGAPTEEAEPLSEEVEGSEVARSEAPEIEEEEAEKEEDECMKQRKKEKEAWRYIPIGCKKFPPEIPASALHYEATEGIIILAIPKSYPKDLCKDPYTISEEAKNAVASPRVEELAKPKYQCEPVKRPEPREKDEWGRPIFPPREYVKKLPKVKPYKPRECPKKKEERAGEKKEERAGEGEGVEGEDEYDESYEDEFDSFEHEGEPKTEPTDTGQDKSSAKPPKKRREKKSRSIDPIADAPSIDPLFDPIGARRQLKERERAKKIRQEEKAEREKAKAAEGGERAKKIGQEEEAELEKAKAAEGGERAKKIKQEEEAERETAEAAEGGEASGEDSNDTE